MGAQIICRIGKSDAKKNAEQTAYNNEILSFVKNKIDLKIRSEVLSKAEE